MNESIVGGLGVKGGYLGASINVGSNNYVDVNIEADEAIRASYFVSRNGAYSMFFNSTRFTESNYDFTVNTVGAAIDECLKRIRAAHDAADDA